MSHVEDLVHLFPACARFFLNQFKQGWNGEEVVFDDVQVVNKMKDLGLGSSRAMYHAVDVGTVGFQQALDKGSVGSGGGENQFAGVQG